MSALIDKLKSEHVTIATVLQEVRDAGITTTEGQNKLKAAKAGLLGHLGEEDKDLYPVLHKAAESNANLKGILDTFAKDMDEITKNVIAFFDKYENVNDDVAGEFITDFAAVFGALGARIQKEESILYPEYDKLA